MAMTMRPQPEIMLEIPAPRFTAFRNVARRIGAAMHSRPRSVAELTPEQRVIYAALRQGAEGGLTVSIPVSVQDRRK